jgi:hypothetical protein
MKKGLDSFQIRFDNAEEFINFLEKREMNTSRISIPAKNLKFFTMEQVKKWYKTDEELASRLGVDIELVKDTEANMNMIVVIDFGGTKEPYLLGASSWVSIKNRIDIYGKGFDLLETEEQVRDINMRLSQLGEEEVQVIIVHDKIRAIMSRMYAVVIAADFFKSILKYSSERFDSFELVEAYADHNVTRCKILFTELREELAEIYKLPDEYIPGLVIQTSDTGFSANRIGAYWQSNKASFINSNEYIYAKHKGEVTLEDILEELPNLFIKYQNTLKKFANLLTIEISQPVKVLKRACKHIGVAKKHTKLLVEELERELSTAGIEITTAYDICRKILSLPNYVTDSTQKTDLQEKVGKAININYVKLEAEEDE